MSCTVLINRRETKKQKWKKTRREYKYKNNENSNKRRICQFDLISVCYELSHTVDEKETKIKKKHVNRKQIVVFFIDL